MEPTVETMPRPSGDVLALQSYPDDGAAPMVLILPAMGVPARYYRHFAAVLHNAGFAVLALDLRGNGASTPKPSRQTRYGYQDLVDDVAAVCAALEPRRAGRPLLLIGHSLGGQVGLLHAANDPAGIVGVVLVAAGVPYWRVYPGRRRYGLFAMTQSIGLASRVLGTDDWAGVRARLLASPALRMIRVTGPVYLQPAADYCGTCRTLSADALATAERLAAGPVGELLDRHAARVQVRAGPVAFARRHGVARYAALVGPEVSR